MGFRFALQHAEQHEIDKTAGERLADGDMQDVRDRERRPSNSACTTYSAGAINRNENSIGSVMPVRNEVSAADSSSPPTRLRFSGRALWYIAGQAPTEPNIMVIKRPDMKRAVPM